MYLLLIFLVLAMVLFTVYLTRSIMPLIAVLQRAAMEIGKGKLQMPLAIHTGGELGALAISFREMADNLSKVTASRDELNKEIVERKQAQSEQQRLMDSLEDKAAEMERFVYTVYWPSDQPVGKGCWKWCKI